jgi:TctA family transporter
MYMKYIYLRFLDNKEKTIWKIRIWEILLIFVLSSFIGLIYISETYMNYIPAELTDSFLVTFETLRFFLGVLLVPIMFKTFEKRSNTFKIREEEIE